MYQTGYQLLQEYRGYGLILPPQEVAMALNSTRELFVFELGRTREMEVRAGHLFPRIADNVQNDALKRALQAHARECHEQGQNITACLNRLGSSPVGITSYMVDALRNTYQEIVHLNPPPHVLDLSVVDLAAGYAEHAATRYRSLFDFAISLGNQECGRLLLTNRSIKEAFIGRLRQFSVMLAHTEVESWAKL